MQTILGAVAIPTSFGSSQVKKHRQRKSILTKVSCLEIIPTNTLCLQESKR